MIRLKKRAGIDEFALDHLSDIETAGLISRRELMRRSAIFGAAATLGIDEGSARMAAHRLRKRYRTLLRNKIAQTLADPTQADDELRELMGAFSS